MKGTNREQLERVTDILAVQVDAVNYLANTLRKDEADPAAAGMAAILEGHIDKLGDALDKIHNVLAGTGAELAA
ncbi:MAG: hypothetical protein FD174_2870 [Geobacteraceae bacterium]|nr:MAG: hypothetical protein FD174_2870 [Geobacteraceae bacterium]